MTQQLMRVTEDVRQAFELGGKTAIIFIDVEKAFDRLWARGLIMKCIQLKLPEWIVLFINSFLSGRKFKVQINQEISEEKIIKAGVPRGSVLGPILFNVFIIDLQVPNPAKLALYADDAEVYVQETRVDRLANKINRAPRSKNGTTNGG